MSNILSIETSTKICSVALHKAGVLAGHMELHIEQSHSSYLVPVIQQLTEYCTMPLDQVDAFAVSKGPGSYTGLRIGVSTAKGLCYSLNKPLIAVNTLDAMAYGVSRVNVNHAMLCPMLDARRMEVYCQLMDYTFNEIEPCQAKIIDEFSFKDYLVDNEILFFGDGAMKCQGLIGSHKNAHFISGIYPSAVETGFLAYGRWKEKLFEDVAYFEPFYLKDFKAGKPKSLKQR